MHIKPQSIKKTCFERYIGQILYYWSKKGPHTNYQNKKLLATYNTSTSLYFLSAFFKLQKCFGNSEIYEIVTCHVSTFRNKRTYELFLWVNCNNKVFP